MAVMLAAPELALPRRGQRSLWSDALRRLARNRAAVAGAVVILALILMAVFAGAIAPHSYAQQFVGGPFDGPSPGLPFGADSLGRDQLSRVIFGARISMAVGVIVQLIVVLVGVPLGAVAGYAGGWLDNLIMRFTDVVYAFPDLLFVILLLAALGHSEINVFLAIAIVSWPTMARLVRAQFLSLRQREFVEAARVAGASHWRIVTRHLLPNSTGPIIVAVTLGIPAAILTEAVLAFLGLGAPPPLPSWGSLMFDALDAIFTVPLLVVFPGLAISITMLSFVFLGDGLRDALDPRFSRTS
ncbi:MAG TPA: ABC transporter permease [Chloroflexota bacterium]|nr:ABC transporter permease [Chloroflexota bacterium]